MAIYLVDYENVYIDGLKGLEQLGEEDILHIFYTQNRCGLTFHTYEQLTRCKAHVQLNEVSVSLKNSDPVKNALDIQLMMFTGYLIGTKQAEQVFIVSKDKDFRLGTDFYERFMHEDGIELRIIPAIEDSFRSEEETAPEEELTAALETLADTGTYPELLHAVQQQLDACPEGFAAFCEQYAAPQPVFSKQEEDTAPEAPLFTVQYFNTVRNLLGKSADEETVSRVCEIISGADTLVDLNNGLARLYRDGERAKAVYHKCKPRFEDLRHLSRARNKG